MYENEMIYEYENDSENMKSKTGLTSKMIYEYENMKSKTGSKCPTYSLSLKIPRLCGEREREKNYQDNHGYFIYNIIIENKLQKFSL